MLTKKLKILSEFKTPLPLMQAKQIKVLLQYEDGRTLEKNNVDIVDAERGIVSLTLSDFEMQGLKIGDTDFYCKVYMENGDVYTVKFSKGQTVRVKGERKVWDDTKH